MTRGAGYRPGGSCPEQGPGGHSREGGTFVAIKERGGCARGVDNSPDAEGIGGVCFSNRPGPKGMGGSRVCGPACPGQTPHPGT